MLTFAETKRNKKEFLALTGLTLKEYKLLLPEFEKAYRQRYESGRTRIGQPRKRKVGGGAVGRLDKIEDKLLFILVYQNSNGIIHPSRLSRLAANNIRPLLLQ